MNIVPFTAEFEGSIYKLSEHKEDEVIYIICQDVLTGEDQTFELLDFFDGSGNEHLRYKLHGWAAHELVKAAQQMFLREMKSLFPPDGRYLYLPDGRINING